MGLSWVFLEKKMLGFMKGKESKRYSCERLIRETDKEEAVSMDLWDDACE